eukprot:382364_1
MSARQSRKHKHKHEHNIKPSHTKKRSSKFTSTQSSKTSSNKKNKNNQHSRKLSKQFQISDTFSTSFKKINNQSFYATNPALVNKQVIVIPNLVNWKQKVTQSCNTYTESLTIRFDCNPQINSPSCKQISTEKALWTEYSKSKRTFKNTMRQLFQPYIAIKSIVDIILQFNGPHLFPIRYSVDLLPYFHTTIRSTKPRMNIWSNASKDNINSQCVLDFTPDTNIMVVEDIYDEWVAYVRKTFDLRSKFSESVIFYIPKHKTFMTISSTSLSGEAKQKQIFTEYYMKALNNFTKYKEYAFRLHLYGINYRYYLQKRDYSPVSWGSRSRCWDGEGMVLLCDGTQKQIKYLSVGDKVAVLNKLPNNINTKCDTAIVKVKIESVVNRKYEMVLVNNKLWITPYHAVLNSKGDKWKLPCQVGNIEERFEESIYNFILDSGHVLCVNGIWACTLGHDLKGDIIENPMWGSSHVMYDMFSKMDGYPNVVEYI